MPGDIRRRTRRDAMHRADAGKRVAIELVSRNETGLVVDEDGEDHKITRACRIRNEHCKSVRARVCDQRRTGERAVRSHGEPRRAARLAVRQRVPSVRVGRSSSERVAVRRTRCRARTRDDRVGELRRDIRGERGDLRRRERVVCDEHIFHPALEQWVSELAFAEIICRGVQADGIDRHRVVDRYLHTVDEQFCTVATERERHMHPLIASQLCGFNDLLRAAILDGEAQCVSAGTGREEHVLVRAVAEIKDALPLRAAVPEHARSEREVQSVADNRRQLHIASRAIEINRLPRHAVGERRISDEHTIVAVAGTVEGIAIERKLRQRARAAGRRRLNKCERRGVVAIRHARRIERAAGDEFARRADPVVDRVTLHERRVVQHVNELADARVILRKRRRSARAPVRTVVEFRDPDGATGRLINAEQPVVILRRRPTALVEMNCHVVHAVVQRVRLRHEIIEPRQSSSRIARGGRTETQPRREQVRPIRDGRCHGHVRLVGLVGLVEAERVRGVLFVVDVGVGVPIQIVPHRNVFRVTRGRGGIVPIITPLRVHEILHRPRPTFLARPTPREHAHETDRVVEVRRQHAHVEIAVLRHIRFADARAVGVLRERGHVTALEPERTDCVVQHAETRVGVVGVLTEIE